MGIITTDFGAVTGMVVQVSYSLASAVATGTTILPVDDTIPQITEGNEYMTLAITPKSATNILVVDTRLYLSSTIATFISTALFQDATANALAATSHYQTTTTAPTMVVLQHVMAAGTTSSITFRMRAGGAAAGTTTFNGTVGARHFGAITKSSIVITEIKA